MAVKDYNTDPDLNTSISGINIAEGCPPSGINNAIRQLMADVKTEQNAKDTAISTVKSSLESSIATTNSNLATTNSNVSALDAALDALDADVVHNTGNETIAGTKTFTGSVDFLSTGSNSGFSITNTAIPGDGSAPSTNRYEAMQFHDAGGNSLGAVAHQRYPSNGGRTYMSAVSRTGGSTAMLEVVLPASGVPYAAAPSTPAGSTGTQIVTADFLQKDLTMAGVKTFANYPYVTRSQAGWYAQVTDLERGPSTALSSHYQFFPLVVFDKNKKRLGGVFQNYYTNGDTSLALLSYKGDSTDNTNAGLYVYCKKDGNHYAVAPTPAANSNASHIATTEWVRGKGVLIESWHEGTEWYRKYSDGWIEQGGYDTSGKSGTVTFHTAFTATPNVVLTGYLSDYGKNDDGGHWLNAVPTKTSFSYQGNGDTGPVGTYWRACGY